MPANLTTSYPFVASSLSLSPPRPSYTVLVTHDSSGWNNFDFGIVVSSWIPYMLSTGGDLSALKLLRLFRLFRIMRLIKFLPQLAVIVESIITGFESIGFIAIILGVVFYLFAIVGMMFYQKNDPFHFGRLHRAMLTLFRVSTFEGINLNTPVSRTMFLPFRILADCRCPFLSEFHGIPPTTPKHTLSRSKPL